MKSGSVRCRSCGHEVDSETLREKFGGACPQCFEAFALEGLNSAPASSPVTSGTAFGKFVLTDLLGQGGMGEVWKAFDGELKRWVALKFLHAESPQELARFQREARTAAGLSHPGIAAIHEVGDAGGRHYIAMQYVEGTTLQHHPRSDRKGLARLVRDAARALEHAHRHGVIHRDLKPENLMVEKGPDGDRVVLLDFGLARPMKGGERLSQTGSVAGTLAYMSPEQARGERLDQRTDVYSLGATLYDVLTGRPPFEGPNAYDVMKRIENDEPVAPRRRNPHIPHDLETITLKCLEKNRERRYVSARDLADDLERFLEGDAILARRASTWYRVRKKLAKRKLVFSTIGIAAAVVSALLGWWAFVGSPGSEYDRRYAAATTVWAEVLRSVGVGGDPEGIPNRARKARLAFERAIEAREDAQGQLMRSRCLQLEGKADEALKVLERARELDLGNAEARVELAKLLFSKYQASRGVPSWAIVTHGQNSEVMHDFGALAPETEEQSQWRVRGEKLLAEGLADSIQERLLQGLLAMGQGDHPRAATELAAYWKVERWDLETLRLECLCRMHSKDFRGAIAASDQLLTRVRLPRDFVLRGMAKSGQRLYAEAITDYDEAIKLNSKYFLAYFNRGIAKDAQGLYDEAIADFDEAVRLEPKNHWAYTNRGSSKHSKGQCNEAIADFNEAITLNPNHFTAYFNRAVVKYAKGLHDDAIADYDKAARLDPKSPRVYFNRGNAMVDKGLYDKAIADYDIAIRLEPSNPLAYYGRGNAKNRKGLHDEAIADFSEALKLNPKYSLAYLSRGIVKHAKGLLDEAIAEFDEAIRLDPKYVPGYAARGLAKYDKGRYDSAIADYDEAIRLNPQYSLAFTNRGNAKSRKGLRDEAIADFTEAIRVDPMNYFAYFNRGNEKAAKGLYDEAIADYKRSLKLVPADSPLRTTFERRLAHFESTASRHQKLKAAQELFEKSNKLHSEGAYSDAIEGFRKIAGEFPKTEIGVSSAYNVACGYALLGERENALGWLEKAVEMGWKDVAHIEKDSDLHSLRGEERYKKLVAKLKGE